MHGALLGLFRRRNRSLTLDFSGGVDPNLSFTRNSLAMREDGVPTSALLTSFEFQFQSMTPGQFASYGLTFTRASLAMMTGSDGMLTYAPNNLLLNSATLSTQSVTVEPGYFIVSFKGSGSITLSNAASAVVTGVSDNDRVFLRFLVSTRGTLTLTVSGTVSNARLSAVTYELYPRTGDDVDTAGSAYHGPRQNYTTAGVWRGLLLEPQRINRALWSRDMTNAVWVKTNMTAAKDQTGMDGIANSASSLTATGANATCLQAITAASAVTIMSCAIKRLVGSGTIEMTTDNGATWLTVTPTSEWTYVSITRQTMANPTCGIRIATSGDSVAVDFMQNETGNGSTPSAASYSSPIPTTSVTVTREADDLQMTGSAFSSVFNQTECTINMSFSTENLAADSTLFCIDTGSGSQTDQIDWRSISSTAIRGRVRSSNASSCDLNPLTFIPGQAVRIVMRCKVNDFAASGDGGAVNSDAAGAMPTLALTRITFGQRGGTSFPQCIMHLRSFAIYGTGRVDADLIALSAVTP